MISFKQHFTEANEEGKGAFKEFPKHQQPNRIPFETYPKLTEFAQQTFGHLGQMFIPSLKKSEGKTSAGDLDVIFVPHNRNTWREDILKTPGIVAHTSNGPQLMLVMKTPLDNNQYMISSMGKEKEVQSIDDLKNPIGDEDKKEEPKVEETESVKATEAASTEDKSAAKKKK